MYTVNRDVYNIMTGPFDFPTWFSILASFILVSLFLYTVATAERNFLGSDAAQLGLYRAAWCVCGNFLGESSGITDIPAAALASR